MARNFDIPGLDKLLGEDADNDALDSDLEDELEAILAGGPVKRKSAPPVPKRISDSRKPPNKSNPHNIDISELEKFAAVNVDEDDDDEMDENNIDENLMAELQGIVGNEIDDHPVLNVPQKSNHQPQLPPPLQPEPVRRQAPPPPVVRKVEMPVTEPLKAREIPRPLTPPVDYSTSDKEKLVNLRDEYKKSALQAKKAGDKNQALEFLKVAKQLDAMLTDLNNGQPVDMTNLPSLPRKNDTSDAAPTRTSRQNPEEHTMHEAQHFDIELPDVPQEEASRLFNAPTSASTVLEALNQRLKKYKETAEQAQAKGDSSKVRRLGRIIKQYESAIKARKSGKEFDYSSLPAPPGFPDIPLEDAPQHPPPPVIPKAVPKPQVIEEPKVLQQQPGPSKKAPAPPIGRIGRQSSIANKQLSYLVERQKLFKEAALESKNKGDIQQALDYLKQAKGFDPLIEATKCGLPIDATSIPTPPQLTDDFVMVTKPEEANCDDLEKDELFRKVEVELNEQIEMCKRNKEHFTKLGDVSSASKFEKYQIDSMKDMDMLRTYWKNGDRLPRYRYETRTFSIVQSNPDLGTNESCVIVLKAIDLPGKDTLDTYVKVEFPFPTVSSGLFDFINCCSDRINDTDDPNNRRQETPQIKKTRVVKDSIHPVFHEKFKFDIDRKSRSLARIFKRHPLKLEVYSKGGFLRSDVLIGTAIVKLNELETKCTLHESYPLTDGRKTVGGRIEVKVQIREPLLSKQVEEVKEKWLVFE